MNPLLSPNQVFDLEMLNPNPTSSKTAAGPVYRVSFEVDRDTWDWFMEADTKGLLLAAKACVVGDVEGAEAIEPTSKGPFGAEASALHFSGFHLSAQVRLALGGDRAFLRWVRLQRCCCKVWVSPSKTETPQHEGPTEAAHVRRITAGAGMGIKPEYSAIPLCQACHARQHQLGESAIGGTEALEKRALRCADEWAWSALGTALGVDSMTQASPSAIVAWAEQLGVAYLLPSKIRAGVKHGEQGR